MYKLSEGQIAALRKVRARIEAARVGTPMFICNELRDVYLDVYGIRDGLVDPSHEQQLARAEMKGLIDAIQSRIQFGKFDPNYTTTFESWLLDSCVAFSLLDYPYSTHSQFYSREEMPYYQISHMGRLAWIDRMLEDGGLR